MVMSFSKHDAKNRSLPDIENGRKVEHEEEKKREGPSTTEKDI